VREQQQLRQRLPDRELPRRRVQDGGRHPQVLLQEDLLAAGAARHAMRAEHWSWFCSSVLRHARCAVMLQRAVFLSSLVLFTWNKLNSVLVMPVRVEHLTVVLHPYALHY